MGRSHREAPQPTYTTNAQKPRNIYTTPNTPYNRAMKQEPTLHGKRRRNFYLPDTLMEEVEGVARKRDVSATTVVRAALEAYLRALKRAELEKARG